MRAQVSFEGSLEDCLQELARTGDLEVSLRRYPQHADQLRPLLEIAQATRQHYTAVPEAPGGLAEGRERLLATATQLRKREAPATGSTGASTEPRARRLRLAFPLQTMAIVLVVLVGTVALGGGVLWAASDSLPGDLLYPVKTATEEVRLALASTRTNQVELALGFVEERTAEMQALTAAGRHVPDGVVARMERHVERALTQAAWSSDEEIGGLLTQIQSRTRTQMQALERVQTRAPGQAQAGLARALAAVQRGAEAAENGLSDPQTFRGRFQHRHTDDEPEPTSEPDPGREREQHRNQERNQQETGTPVGTPHVTPQAPKATSGPQVTRIGLPETPGPQGTIGPEETTGPEATSQGPGATTGPEATPQGPGTTTKPGATAQGPGPTAGPKATPQGAGATAAPQPTSQGPGATAAPQPTSKGPGPTSEPPGKTSERGSGGGHSGGH